MGEIRQTNFRIDQESADAFRAFCEAHGMNQAQGFNSLLQAMELNEARAAIPERDTEIANFQAKATELVEAFLHSLQLNQDAEARIRGDFQTQLASKDKTIADYQQKLEEEKAKSAQLAETQLCLLETQQTAAEALNKLTAKEEELLLLHRQSEKQLEDKDSIVTMLTEKLAAAEAKAEGYNALAAERDALTIALKAAQDAQKELEREHEIKLERAAMEAEKALNAAVRAAEKEAEKVIKAAEKDAMDALKELRRMEAEKAELREELAKYKAAKKGE